MALVGVRVPYVVDLEAKRVLQVVARLFARQPGHDRGSLCNVYDLERASLGQRPGNFVYLLPRWHPVRLQAEIELPDRADVAEFTDTNVTVVVR